MMTLRKKAPTRIATTIAVVRTVPSQTSRSMRHDSRPRWAVMASAPTMPTAAASVAVATPKKMAPITIRRSTSGGRRSGSSLRRISQLVSTLWPPHAGFQMQATSTVRLNRTVRMKPGRKPARYSLGTDVSVITP